MNNESNFEMLADDDLDTVAGGRHARMGSTRVVGGYGYGYGYSGGYGYGYPAATVPAIVGGYGYGYAPAYAGYPAAYAAPYGYAPGYGMRLGTAI